VAALCFYAPIFISPLLKVMRYAVSTLHIVFKFTCIIPRGAPFAGGAPLLGGEGPP